MAHGFLTPQSVSGDNFWQNANWLWEKLSKAKIWPLSKKQDLIYAHTTEIRNLLKAGQQKKLTGVNQKALPAGKTPLLGPGAGALAKRNGGIVEKNPTNIDVREGRKQLTPGGPKLPGDTGESVSKGGSFVDLGSTQAKPLNAENFFAKAQTGVGDSGEYLTKAQRIADFRKSQEMRAASSAAPGISADSGVDIVAAVNRNTQMMVSLVEAVKAQTSNDSKIANYQAETQQKFMLRAAASKKEDELEKNKDLSGFMTPENLRKREEGKLVAGGGGGGGRNRFDDAMTAIDLAGDINDIRRGKTRRVLPGRDGRTSRERLRDMKMRKAGLTPRSSSGSLSPRGGLSTGRALGAARSGGLGKGLGGAAKGAGKGVPGLNVLLAGLEFGDRMGSGQSALQAGVGTAGSIGGGMAGAAAGAALGSIVPGVGTLIGGLIGGALGSMTGGGLADRLTGANDVTRMADGGVLVGEAGLEGVFPLAGPKGKKTFSLFGEGILDAQTDNRQEFAKLQSAGLKQYYEKEGGFEKMGEGLKGLFDGLGSALSALLTPAANAGTMPGGGFASADEQQLTEALIAGEEGMRTEAYKDSEGIWTIGYGQTTLNGRAVKQGDKITKEQALEGFRSNVGSHRQRAINQVGEKRWQELDPKARAVLTSLAYNYGSIPEAVLPAAKTGSTEDIAKSMDKLYGHNKGVLKGRRQREQSILRGGTSERLDMDFMAGGKLAAESTGPMVMGVPGTPPGGGGAGTLAETATRLKGLSTNVKETDYGRNGCVYAVNKVFKAAGITPPWGSALYVPTAEEKMINAGWQKVSYDQAQPGDVMIMKDRGSPPQAHIGIMQSNGKVLSNSSGRAQMTWEDTISGYNRYYGSQGTLYRMPSGVSVAANNRPPASNANPKVANANPKNTRSRGSGSSPGSVKPATPAPVPAVAASTNPGTNVLASSQQVAMGTMGLTASAPTVINNYYTTASGANQGMAGNGVGPGITMNGAAGVAWINQLAAMTRV